MGNVSKNDKHEYVLENDYLIHTVSLSKIEEEHTHQFAELVYTLSGKGVHRIDGKEFHVKTGDLLWINYHSHHAVLPSEALTYMDIMVKPEYVNEALRGTDDLFLLLQLRDFADLSNKVERENVLLHFNGEERKRFEFLLNWTEDEQRQNLPAKDLILHSALSMLLSMVFRKMSEHQNIRLTVNDFLLSYIERNCHNKLLIHDIAAMCGYTPEHFTRIFKEYTGKTPMRFILDARIQKAKALLLKTDLSVEHIVTECGFSNRTAFFKSFFEQVGATPLQYRKNQK